MLIRSQLPTQHRAWKQVYGHAIFLTAWVGWLTLASVFADTPVNSPGNRLTYLDAFLDPYYVGTASRTTPLPKLTTPQWVGEPGVEAVVVLAIDDMRDPARYEAFLRPILDRLKAIDGRAAVSIMTCTVTPDDPQLTRWLVEGVSLEVHTITHPCPLLRNGDFQSARQSYEQCVDLMASIPGNRPVAFRMPCCDSLNTPSPRFWTEIFNRTTEKGNFLFIDSSVFQIFTPEDPELPRDLVLLPSGESRFRRYIPFPSFVNTIENYPYPYVIGKLCWEFPCMVPSDWEAQNIQRPNNPDTVRDWKVALDLVVLKQGVFNLVFHPHNWIRNDQVVELIDYAVAQYGKRVKFLTFKEAHERLVKFLLANQPLRRADGSDNGVRMLDLNHDGWMDVVIGNDQVRLTRVWDSHQDRWQDGDFPVPVVTYPPGKPAQDGGVRFAIKDGQVVAWIHTDERTGAWQFTPEGWKDIRSWMLGATDPALHTARAGIDRGVRFRDLDGDGTCELLVGNPERQEVWKRGPDRWQLLWSLPAGVQFVDELGRDAGLRLQDLDGDGFDDIVFSDVSRYGVYLMRPDEKGQRTGWTTVAQEGTRGQSEGEPIPMIVRGGTNNGAWFHSRHLWVQNEDTSRLPDHVDRRSYADLLGKLADFPPPRSPAQSLRSLHVHPRCCVQLVAWEPLVQDPIAFDWALDGSVWVVEMSDYPNGTDQGPQGRIKRLFDTDGDGVYDRASVFCDRLLFPTGVKTWRRGALVLCPPELFYAEDTDGDGTADVRQVLYRGFAPGNPQHRANGMCWGMDGWLYVANGDSGGTIQSLRTGAEVSISGRDVRLKPDTGELEPVSGQTQYGRSRDDWDNWFGGNNANPLWHYVLPEHYLRRNPHWPVSNPRHDVPEFPGAAPVYPRSFTLARFNDFNMANRFTSACSPEVYRDRLLGETFAGNVFICEPVHNLVHRLVIMPHGVTFLGRRAPEEQQSEFLASEDNWFRPVMVRTGPDGALWIADMYRLVIEHPEWIPQVWQEKLDLRAGAERGRLYRVLPAGGPARPVPRLDRLSLEDWVGLLDQDNGWLRDMAQQVLIWENATGHADRLAQLARNASRPATRAQALATLDILNVLSDDVLNALLGDQDARVRRIAVRIAARRVATWPSLVERLTQRASTETDAGVLLELLFALGEIPSTTPLWKLAMRADRDRFMQAAFASSLRVENIEGVVADIVAVGDAPEALPPVAFAAPVIRFLSATQNFALLARLFQHWQSFTPRDDQQRLQQWQLLAEVLERWPAAARQKQSQEVVQQVEALLLSAQRVALDVAAPVSLRAAAGRLLAVGAWNRQQAARLLASMLQPSQPAELQVAAIDALARFPDTTVADLLLEGWRSYSPAIRARVLDGLLARPEWVERLLDAIQQNRIQVSELDAARRQQLFSHRVEALRQRANQLLAQAQNTNRQAIVEQYQVVKTLAADPQRGRSLFAKHCSSCHRLDDQGSAVGPDLASLADRSLDSLLVAVLDPNRAVEDKFREYIAVLQDGRQFRGILATESANSITLLGQEGKSVDLLRSELDTLVSTGQSLMPEGVENDIPPQDLADILAYVRLQQPPPKSFSGNSPRLAHVRDDGSIRLLATECRIYGPTLVFEEQYRNLGYWGSLEDRAVWDLHVPRSGTYRVILDYACQEDTAGNRFRIDVGGQALTGTVESTGTWDQYRRKTVGRLVLKEGRCELTFRAEPPLQGYLIDLREIVLDPEDKP